MVWTPSRKTELLNLRARLHRLLASFRRIQATYMPPVAATANSTTLTPPPVPKATSAIKRKRGDDPVASEDDLPDKPDPVELQALSLPSELPPNILSACHPGLDDIEQKMRDAQCRSSLDSIRTHLYIKSSLWTFKARNARAQRQNTRARTTINQNDAKIKVFQDKYNAARKALIALGADEAMLEWRKLENGDLWCLEDPEEIARKNEKQQK